MKKSLGILIGFFIVLTSPSVFLGAEPSSVPKVGITSTTEDPSLPKPGISVSPQGSVSVPVKKEETKSALLPDPKPKKKEGTVAKAEKEPKPKKEKKTKKEEEVAKIQKDMENIRMREIQKTVDDQVKALREERAREMPYLDRIYIQTTITPLKMQQKQEFLAGGPKDLSDLIMRAQSVHTQARSAHESISLYHRRVLHALRKLFPEMTLNFNEREGLQGGSIYTGGDWHFNMRQPLFNGGILWNTFLQEKAGLEAAKKQYEKTIAELVFDVSRAYFEYQRTLQTIEEHKVAVEKIKRYAEMSEEKFKQKIISEIEYLNVQSSYSQMQLELESAKQDFELAKLELQKYLDLSERDDIVLSTMYNLSNLVIADGEQKISADTPIKELPTIFQGENQAPELNKLIDLSYANRAELQIEAAKLQVTRLGERIRWGEFLPKANLTGEWGELGEAYRYQGYGGIDSNVDAVDEPVLKKEWRLMLEVNWNLGGNKMGYTYERDHKAPSITQYWYGGVSQTTKNGFNVGVLDGLDVFINVKQAEVDKLNQVVELEKAEKQVLQDVKQAYYDYQKAVIQVRSTIKRMKYRERLREFSEHRLSRKEIEIGEYIQAEADLVRERSDLHKALKDYFTAKASLNHAIGISDFLGIESPHGPRSV